MISYKKHEKLYESLSNLTDIYSDLIEIAKSFEEILGPEDMSTTGILDAISKVNELILRYNPSASELDMVDEPEVQGLQDLETQPQSQFDAQMQLQEDEPDLQLQGQDLQLQGQGLQAQGQGLQAQTQLEDQVQQQL